MADARLSILVMQAHQQLERQANLVRAQTSLRMVVHLMNPQVPGYLRSLVRADPAVRRLRQACEDQAKTLLERQLTDIGRMDSDAGAQAFNRLYQGEWQLLRGNFPRLFARIERERMRMRSAEPNTETGSEILRPKA